MLELKQLSRSFGAHKAVRDVSFALKAGDIVGLLGPNGAGKSTTMRMVCGVLEPDSGDAHILGHSITSDRREAQRLLGYLPEGAPLYPDMTVVEFLGFLSDVRQLGRRERKSAIERVIADARIASVARQQIGTLSKGYRRRVGLAGAILHDPPVLVLDEPTDGLDPIQKRTVRSLIARMAPEKAIVISTHTLEEVPAMCNRTVVIDKGLVIADETPAAFAARGGGSLEAAFMTLVAGAATDSAVDPA